MYPYLSESESESESKSDLDSSSSSSDEEENWTPYSLTFKDDMTNILTQGQQIYNTLKMTADSKNQQELDKHFFAMERALRKACGSERENAPELQKLKTSMKQDLEHLQAMKKNLANRQEQKTESTAPHMVETFPDISSMGLTDLRKENARLDQISLKLMANGIGKPYRQNLEQRNRIKSRIRALEQETATADQAPAAEPALCRSPSGSSYDPRTFGRTNNTPPSTPASSLPGMEPAPATINTVRPGKQATSGH